MKVLSRRLSGLSLAAIIIGVGTFAVVGSTRAPESSSAATSRSGLPWVSGGTDDKGIGNFEAFRGRNVDIRVTWAPADKWANVEPAWAAKEFQTKAEPYRMSYAIPLITSEAGQTLATCANGGNDAHYLAVAKNVVKYGQGDAILRPGWEGSAPWYAWGVTNARNGTPAVAAANYKSCMKRFSTVVKSVSSGFLIDFNAGTSGGVSFTDMYPGDQYIDIVGNDFYAKYDLKTSADFARYCTMGTAASPVGLCRYAEYARAHGKLFSAPEWGMDVQYAAVDGVAYVAGMAKLFYDYRDVLAYEGYYNRTNDAAKPCNFRLDSGCNAKASAEYLKWFGPTAKYGATPTPAATPVATATPSSAPTPTVTRTLTPAVTRTPTASATPTKTPVPTPTPVLAADINRDGKVNVLDLSALLSGWGRAGASDVNGDGTTNVLDLSRLLSAWTQ